jgi:acyl carrier protein
MNKDEIFLELRQLLVELFELSPEDVHLDTDLYADLDIDSIDAVDLLASLREKTGQRLSPEKFREVRTVSDVVDRISEQLAS